LQPANLLVMDEPTNDLDAETLEMLESVLLDYPGTLLLVSHDRAFVNNVVTSVLAFDDDGVCRHYAGGYDDWQRQRPRQGSDRVDASPKSGRDLRPAPSKPKLTFRESQELAELPAQIEALEVQRDSLTNRLADANLYQNQPEKVAPLQGELLQAETALKEAYERWEHLAEKAEQLGAS
jgi:ATP-binding cassette subfamily F protein uup